MAVRCTTFHHPALIAIVPVFILSTLVVVPAQIAPKDTKKATDPKPGPKGRVTQRPRPPRSVTPSGAASNTITESDRFLALGDRFREKGRWNAAEAAYKEAVNVWPSNPEALEELGYIYLYSNRPQEAQSIYSKLRAVKPAYAQDLLTEINRRKANQ